MAHEPKDNAFWQLRMFSYLLMICGLFGFASAAVVAATALSDGATAASWPLSAFVLGASGIVTNGITMAAGVVGRAASRNPQRLSSLRTVSLAGVVCAVMGLGLCYAVGGNLPTALLFDLLLLAICLALTGSLKKTLN